MTINYVGEFKANIIFDEVFTYYDDSGYHPIHYYVDRATYEIGEYHFVTAKIVDCSTGDVLVEMHADENVKETSFDVEPEWYDDGETCGYE